MTYLLNEINRCAQEDPKGLIEQSEAAYHARIETTATQLLQGLQEHPIILVNGPSSSSKTTTAGLMSRALNRHGVRTVVISMDDYYRTRSTYTVPKDEEGVLDFESPECMDLPLLSMHLQRLAEGAEIQVPRFDFKTQSRTEEVECLRLGKDEVAVIEGIHSLNNEIMGKLGDKARGVYLSIQSAVTLSENELLEPHMLRFLRRAVRDRNFRGAPVPATLLQWRSIRRGERLYIAPYRQHAQYAIDTYLPYESCILMNQLQGEISKSETEMSLAGLSPVFSAIGRFAMIDFEPFIPENSIIHEFVG